MKEYGEKGLERDDLMCEWRQRMDKKHEERRDENEP